MRLKNLIVMALMMLTACGCGYRYSITKFIEKKSPREREESMERLYQADRDYPQWRSYESRDDYREWRKR
jgi:hypothetical protein